MICYRCRKEFLPGAVKQHGLHESCFRENFALAEHTDFLDIVVKNAASRERDKKASDDQFARINFSFFHGKFKKYSANLNGVSYILKVKDANFPELPGVEYLSNQLAESVKIMVPDFYFIKFEDQLETFMTRNFMQDFQPANLVHIYNFFEKEANFNCQNLIRIIEEKTGRLNDIERFVEITLFDSLIGNHDRHGRNLALIQTKKGYQLSPFYDNPSQLGVEEEAFLGAHLEPRGKIATEHTDEPTMKDYVAEFKRLEYGEVVKKFFNRIRLDEMFELIGKAFISDKRKKGIRALMERRYKELENNVGN